MQLHAIAVVNEQVLLLRSGKQTFVVQKAGVADCLMHVELLDNVQWSRTRRRKPRMGEGEFFRKKQLLKRLLNYSD